MWLLIIKFVFIDTETVRIFN